MAPPRSRSSFPSPLSAAGLVRRNWRLRAQRAWWRARLTLELRRVPPVDGLTVVTAADTTHAISLRQLLASLVRHEPGTAIIVFDLGLTEGDRAAIATRFPAVELRRFPFEQYPAHFEVSVRAGEYAWKPAIVAGLLEELDAPVCWLDAGDVLAEPLDRLRRLLAKKGFFAPQSAGTIERWTHPTTLRCLGASADVRRRRNLNAAVVAFDPRVPGAAELARRWRACALERECIAPEGSGRRNHRQDQAVLSVLAHQAGLAAGLPPISLGIRIHQDLERREKRPEPSR